MSANNNRRSFEDRLVAVLMVLCFVLAVTTITIFVGDVLIQQPANSAVNVELIVAATLTALAPPATATPTDTPISPTAVPLPPTSIPPTFAWPTPILLTPTPASIMAEAAPVVVPPQPAVVSGSAALPYEQICDPNNTFTALQEEEMIAAMVGKQVVGWRGRIWDVVSDGDFFKVQVIMGDGVLSAPTVEILGVSRDVAIGLSAEQYITFDGTISEIELFLGSICIPLKIIGATIRPDVATSLQMVVPPISLS